MLSRLRSSRLVALLALTAWAGSVHANGITVRITEVMSSSGAGGTADWFEITNYGTTAVDITGWRMDDNSFTVASSLALVPYAYPLSTDPAWSLLQPGESAVMLEVTTLTPATQVEPFKTFWNLGVGSGNIRNPKIATYAGSGASFSSGGDGVVVFDAAGTEVTPRVNFGGATTGSTFYWSYDAAGQMATATGGVVSTVGVADGYSSTGTPTNIGSPGIAVVAAPTVSRYWTANGTALGGSGSWTTAGTTWSATATPVTATTWANGALAVFDGTAGTITVNAAVSPLGLSFVTGSTLAAGTGSITTPSIEVAAGQTATIAARLTGSTGVTLLGGGTLVLSGTANDYTGATSVGAGTLRAGASEVIPNGSRLAVSRFATADLSGFTETVAGFSGLGSITLGSSLTVNVTGSAEAVFDGTLTGSGDLVIDSSGTGAQRLDASTQTIGDGAVKNYTGATTVRRGTLRVDFNGIPTQTSGVTVQAGGRLQLGSDTLGFEFTFGGSAALPITVSGGTLGQAAGDDVTLFNAVNVTANSTFAIQNSNTPDPASPTTEEMILAGPLTGTAGRTITITASATTPGADKGRVTFASAAGNTFTGTIRPQVNAWARFAGPYAGVSVVLDQGGLDGSGTVGAVSGSGTIAPVATFGPTVLTATSVTASATTGFLFEYNTANAEPTWSSPTASGNSVLRLTDSTALPTPLGSGNVVRLFLNVTSLTASDTFTGGFFTTADSTASISGASYQTFVYGDGFGTDITYNDVGWYSLASYNTRQGLALSTGISMVPVTAGFGGSPTSGFAMRASYAPSSNIVIDVPSGSLTQAQAGYAAIVVADSVTKTGAGTVVFDAANSYTGPTTVSAGTLRVANANAVAASAVTVASGATLAVAPGTTMKAPSVTVNGGTLSGGTVAVNAATGIQTLTINSGTVAGTTGLVVGPGGLVDLPDASRVTLGVASLAVDQAPGGGKLDLGAGQITIAAGGISAANLRADIVAGFAGGSWNGTTGITSGTAAASGGTRAVGYVVAGDGSARVSFAAPGDTNLDGTVDLLDLLEILGSGTYEAPVPAVWAQGDFNYDGATDLLDLLAILGSGTYDQGSYFPVAAGSPGGLVTPAAVPEPGATGLLLVSAASIMLGLRRRR